MCAQMSAAHGDSTGLTPNDSDDSSESSDWITSLAVGLKRVAGVYGRERFSIARFGDVFSALTADESRDSMIGPGHHGRSCRG